MKKQKGGSDSNNVISASTEMIKSMTELGSSIYKEIIAITHIQDDINNGASATQSIPTVNGPPPFTPP